MSTGWTLGPLGGSATDLRNLGINIVDADGWDSMPGKRAANPEIAYNDGEYSDPRKWFSGRTLPLKFILLDQNTAGGVTHPYGAEGHLRENIDTLLGLLYARNNHLSLRKDVPAPVAVGGRHEREAVVEVIDLIPILEEHKLLREAIVQFRMVEGLWRQIETTGTAAPQKTAGLTGQTGTSHGFNVVTGGNAPVRGGISGAFEVIFTANSAITNPKLTVDSTGEFVQYSGTLTAGEILTFDIGQKTIVIDDSGTLARADSGKGVQHAWWLDLDPASTIAVTATIQAASNFDIEVKWYDRWL
jgi:hypothetical protein